MGREDEVGPLLRVACYRILERFGDNGVLSGAAFNKLMTLLNRRLLEARVEQRIDMGLPHCWYLFGDEVVPKELPRIVTFTPADALVQRTTFVLDQKAERPTGIPDWQSRRLSAEIRELESEFGNPIDLAAIVDEVYEGAPFEFQRHFLDMRRRLRGQAELWKFEEPVLGIVRPLFEAGISTFPASDFPQLKPLNSQFRRIGRFALEQGLPALEAFDKISGEYWQAFCYYLRVHDRGHFHVSEGRLSYWRRIAPEYLASTGPRMNTYAAELVAAFADSIDPLDRAALVGSDWNTGKPDDSVGADSLVYQ